MIISLFGPDGVGKSTIAQALTDAGVCVFSGTDVASWPDQTWHNELLAQGLHEPSIDDLRHFLLKIEKAHHLARQLEQQYGIVAVDSDPLHKTLMFDRLKGNQRRDELWRTAGYVSGAKLLHVHTKISDMFDNHDQAVELQRRLSTRQTLIRVRSVSRSVR